MRNAPRSSRWISRAGSCLEAPLSVRFALLLHIPPARQSQRADDDYAIGVNGGNRNEVKICFTEPGDKAEKAAEKLGCSSWELKLARKQANKQTSERTYSKTHLDDTMDSHSY